MNQAQIVNEVLTGKPHAAEPGLIDLMIDLAKHKKLILGLPLIAAIAAAALTFVLPEVYKASTTLMPPQQSQSGAAALLSQLGGVAGAAAGVAGLKSPNDVYVAMLKSRTVADKLVAQYHLKEVYATESLEGARKALESNTAIKSGKDGLITIEVEDRDKKLAAKLANSYVSQLLDLTRVLGVTEAAQRRMFYERQLEQSKDNLAKAEMSLKGGLSTGGVISVDSESRATVETIGRVKGQISAKEIQLNSMRAFVTTTNPEFMRVQEELASLRAELGKLENGRPGAAEAGEAPRTPMAKQAGFENIKLLRDVKYYQMLYELLAKQYEIARLDEAKDPSIIQVLDPALEPERRFKPQRTLIVLLTAIAAFVVAVAWAVLAEAKQRALASPAGHARWKELQSRLRFGRP